MQYLGDYAEDYATLNFKFSTHKADGTPATLSGTPAISIYKANGTTQSTAGITLTADFDSVTGLNNVLIDLSADAFYAVANDYSVVITTGTVDSVSVVGTVLAHFSIENRFNEVDVTKISGDSTAADNLESACDNYSATRGLAGTALPAAAADAAGGLPISDAGALDLDTLLTRLDAAISTRLASAGYTAPANSDIATILSRIIGTLATGTHNPQSGDAFSRIGAAGAGLTAIGDTRIANLDATISSRSTLTAQQVWEYATRTLSSFGSLVSDVATAVWGAVARTITGGTITTNSDKTGYTVSTVSDKTGYSLTVTPPTAEQIRSEIDNNSTRLADINGATVKLDTAMELDGAVYRFTTNALEEAPSSSGGDATAANQTIIINHLTDVKGATFSGPTDSLEAIRNRGDVAWITGGTGGGSNAVTINVKASAVNVVDCYVEVWDSAGTSFISRTTTNSSGNVTFNLDNNTYTVKVHKTGYYFANQTLTVDGVESVAYTGTILVPSAPADPEMCRVYGFFLNPDGTIITGLTGNALVTCYQEDNTVYAGTEAGTYVTTGIYAGMMYFDIARGATATVTLEAISYSKTFAVPELDTEELKDL